MRKREVKEVERKNFIETETIYNVVVSTLLAIIIAICGTFVPNIVTWMAFAGWTGMGFMGKEKLKTVISMVSGIIIGYLVIILSVNSILGILLSGVSGGLITFLGCAFPMFFSVPATFLGGIISFASGGNIVPSLISIWLGYAICITHGVIMKFLSRK